MPDLLVEFPADDPERALRFWRGPLGVELERRNAREGEGWEANRDGLRLGIHERGKGPGGTGSLPYFTVGDMPAALDRVRELDGSIVHPGERWAICRNSEGRPLRIGRIATGFGLSFSKDFAAPSQSVDLTCRTSCGRRFFGRRASFWSGLGTVAEQLVEKRQDPRTGCSAAPIPCGCRRHCPKRVPTYQAPLLGHRYQCRNDQSCDSASRTAGTRRES